MDDNQLKQILSFIGGIVSTIFLIILIGSFSVNEPTQKQTEPQKPIIELQEIYACPSDFNLVAACGKLKNNSSKMLDIRLYINAYDANGNQIKDGVIYINNLEPNNIYKFKDGYYPKETKKVKVVSVRY